MSEEPRLNPYSPSSATLEDDLVPRRMGLLITAVIILFMSGYGAVRMPATIESFAVIYKDFGADLGGLTNAVLAAPWIWYLFTVAGLPIAVWIIAKSRVRRDELANMKLAARTFLFVYLLTFAVTAYAIYLPIFRLGSVV